MEKSATVRILVSRQELSDQVRAAVEQSAARLTGAASADWVVADHLHSGIPAGAILVCREDEVAAGEIAARRVGGRHLVALPMGVPYLRELLAARPAPAAVQRVVCVSGAPGGAGASTIAVAMAVAAAEAGDTLLVDADPDKLGITAVLGGCAGDWSLIDDAAQRLDVGSVREALPVISPGLWLLAGEHPNPLGAVSLACDVGRRGFSTTVLDTGGRSPLKLPEGGVDDAVLVVRACLSGVLSARRLLREWITAGIQPELVVRATGLVPAEAVGAALELPVKAEIGHWRALPEHWESGEALAGRARKRLSAWGRSCLPPAAPAATSEQRADDPPEEARYAQPVRWRRSA
ncbi:MAG: hypothetical protein ACOYEV_08810 [Candidatus Nanopelagicales bacterium]